MEQLMKLVTKDTCFELILTIPRSNTSYTVIRYSYHKSSEPDIEPWISTTKIDRVIELNKKDWLKLYIDLNTE